MKYLPDKTDLEFGTRSLMISTLKSTRGLLSRPCVEAETPGVSWMIFIN